MLLNHTANSSSGGVAQHLSYEHHHVSASVSDTVSFISELATHNMSVIDSSFEG
jgi:plastocyanin